MPRQLRIQYEGAIYYLMSRGESAGGDFFPFPEQFSVVSPAEKCESKKGTLKFSHSLKRNEAARTLGVPQPLS
jgi:hypothetical protein